jgi:ankyrin repeat protein
MTHSLPSRPSLEYLKNQAKALLRAAREGVPETLARFAQHLEPLHLPHAITTALSAPQRRLKLADAQHVLAKEYGFANWAQLKQHVDEAALIAQSREEQIAVLIKCCLDGELARAERFLEHHPELASADVFIAATLGEEATVRTMLERDPTLAHTAGGPLDAFPLVYACSSRYASPNNSREPQLRAIANELLQRGADPNARWLNPAFNNCPLSALYGACGMNGNVALGQLLLEAGATPDDNESLYHSVEHESADCTALLLAHDATISGTNAVHNAVALGNTAALRLFLQHGADVNERIGTQQGMTLLHWAIDSDQDRDLLELLISHGADLRATSQDGLTPFRRAVRCGHRVAVELLTLRGVAESLSPDEEFVAACMLGDEPLVSRLVAARPTFIDELPADCRGLLSDAAWRGKLEAVRTMLAVGFDVSWENIHRATALHTAAWQGHLQLVQLLLQHGAPLDVKETEFQCTPLEWALHGSYYCRPRIAVETTATRDETYAAIVAAILAAGSPRPVDRLVRICSGRVRDVLEEAGIVIDDDDC